MKTELLIAEFLSTPWALMPERLNAVSAVMARWSNHAPATAEVLAGIDTDKLAREARRQGGAPGPCDGQGLDAQLTDQHGGVAALHRNPSGNAPARPFGFERSLPA